MCVAGRSLGSCLCQAQLVHTPNAVVPTTTWSLNNSESTGLQPDCSSWRPRLLSPGSRTEEETDAWASSHFKRNVHVERIYFQVEIGFAKLFWPAQARKDLRTESNGPLVPSNPLRLKPVCEKEKTYSNYKLIWKKDFRKMGLFHLLLYFFLACLI